MKNGKISLSCPKKNCRFKVKLLKTKSEFAVLLKRDQHNHQHSVVESPLTQRCKRELIAQIPRIRDMVLAHLEKTPKKLLSHLLGALDVSRELQDQLNGKNK